MVMILMTIVVMVMMMMIMMMMMILMMTMIIMIIRMMVMMVMMMMMMVMMMMMMMMITLMMIMVIMLIKMEMILKSFNQCYILNIPLAIGRPCRIEHLILFGSYFSFPEALDYVLLKIAAAVGQKNSPKGESPLGGKSRAI